MSSSLSARILQGKALTLGVEEEIPGILWGYYPDEKATQPRGSMFWRAGFMDENLLYLLSTETLVCLNQQGVQQWIYRLPAEGMNSEAQILPLGNALIIITTDTLLKIDKTTGQQIAAYGYDSSRRSAFQRTLLLPRYSFVSEGSLYGFIGPTLLKFDGETLARSEVKNFNSSPKTLPVLYNDRLAVALDNGFFELYDLKSGENNTLISGSPRADFSIRQPLVHKGLLFVPASDELVVYQDTDIFARNASLTNAILSGIEGRLWMRGHNTGILSEIDETLSIVAEGRYASPVRAGFIDAPLAGTAKRILHLETLNGALTVIDASGETPSVVSTHVSEDFGENPPLKILGARGSLVLIGGFDGAFLINLDLF